MKNKQLVENILKHVGGTANIATAAHCMTRGNRRRSSSAPTSPKCIRISSNSLVFPKKRRSKKISTTSNPI